MVRIAPSLLAADFASLASELERVGSADLLHLDIMDGAFVPNITFGPGLVSCIRPKSNLFFDVHLMVEQPERCIAEFAKAGADGITVHVESTRHVCRALSTVRDLGLKAGVALNPGTPVTSLEFLMNEVDMVLLMTVNPGFGGQGFIPWSLEKIRVVRAMIDATGRDIALQVDGGIAEATARLVVEAGADILVSGVGVFKAESPSEAIRSLRAAARCS